MVISATRIKTHSFDVPASIDLVEGERLREGRLQVNLSEGLAAIAGINIQNRQNYAQDLQISVRGFGARSTFGVRGVRIYVDGIPATMPDGQGQISNIDLGSVGRIEILRGPFSSLYGNSSGGVIQIFSEEARAGSAPTVTPGVALGSDRTQRGSVKLSGVGSEDSVVANYLISASHFETDGSRKQSAARRDIANAKWVIHPDTESVLNLIVNHVALPKAQDPLGLSREQYEADPHGVDIAATQFNTRKTITQTQGGASYERKLNSNNTLRLMAYGGARTTEQFQAIPVAAQLAASSAGGVINLERNYSGADLRWINDNEVPAGSPRLSVVAGLSVDKLQEARRGYQNFTGGAADRLLGVKGALRRDEDNRITAFDQYAQLSWQIDPRWSANAGVRHSRIQFQSNDHYIATGNPDDSGAVSYSAVLPVLGLLYQWNRDLNFYLTAGRGFETPTANELAYTPNGQTGLNFALQPARSKSLEIGAKVRLPSTGRINAALFETNTENEIVTLSNLGGRSTFTNAGDTRRRGLELTAEQPLAKDWRVVMSATLLDAIYSSAFKTCTATPCATPTTQIAAGRRIPGIARSTLYGELAWEPPQGWRLALETRRISSIAVNDLNTDTAAGYTIANVRAGYVTQWNNWRVHAFARGDNLSDRRYAGSVIVNEGNGRFFEPAQGRNVLIGASANMAF